MKPTLDIIIPTYDNPQLLASCLNSFKMTLVYPIFYMVRIIVVNNGHPGLKERISESPNVLILEAGKNLGWEGGLKFGLEHSTATFVAFCNDDIRVMTGSQDWFWKLMSVFNDPKVGGVGPSSNFVMGPQNMFLDIRETLLNTMYLIGFFFIVRRKALDRAGGIDDTLPGGDDIDLSIRLRDAGYSLVCCRDVFVFHHGQATGQRVHAGYWNSPLMQEKTNIAIIKKHGMLKYYQTMVLGYYKVNAYSAFWEPEKDSEGTICKKYIKGENILEVGCGGRKTHEKSVGVDMYPHGTIIPLVTDDDSSCLSDLVADVSIEIPTPAESQDTIIARHILEHCQDTLGTLSVWNKALKMGGRLIIAVPNQALGNTVVMNPEHVVSFTPNSLKTTASVCGFKLVEMCENVNGISMVMIFDKDNVPVPQISTPEPTRHALAARQISEAACV